MTPRQVRRAAERKERKQERKAANGFVFSPDTTPATSPSQLAANRANGLDEPAFLREAKTQRKLSTGPKTPEGKAKSCMNAVKAGLTGRTVLLPSDDAQAYEQHIRDWFDELRPVGPRECALAQSLADNSWRVLRLPALEMAIFALGRQQFSDQFEKEDPALRPGLIELHTYLTYEKQLKNLHLQEASLRRQHDKDTAELRQLQQERQETAAAVGSRHASTEPETFQNGFEFSPDPLPTADIASTAPQSSAPSPTPYANAA